LLPRPKITRIARAQALYAAIVLGCQSDPALRLTRLPGTRDDEHPEAPFSFAKYAKSSAKK
jgi:hypothetical protein